MMVNTKSKEKIKKNLYSEKETNQFKIFAKKKCEKYNPDRIKVEISKNNTSISIKTSHNYCSNWKSILCIAFNQKSLKNSIFVKRNKNLLLKSKKAINNGVCYLSYFTTYIEEEVFELIDLNNEIYFKD